MIDLDGSEGEGGGQILRTALTLAMISGQAFTLRNIRAGRAKPGLLRQHLTAVQAAAVISDATVDGAALASRQLRFVPGSVRAGDYRFAIGTAGSTALVLQTVLPALWCANAPSTVHITGGTHNAMAPPVEFLQEAWLPLLARMGATADITLLRHGFFPAGGGALRASAQPSALRPIDLPERGELRTAHVHALVAGIPREVAERETKHIADAFTQATTAITQLPQTDGPGNVVSLLLAHANVTELFFGFGERGRSSERVAGGVVREARAYLASGAAVGEHLADQLVLPMALAGGGSFTTMRPSNHLLTNISVIQRFVGVQISVDAVDEGQTRWHVRVGTRAR